MENNLSSLSLAGWLFRKQKEITWDGTQGMPVMTLADPLHKDGGKYYSI
jgi:hypothetical protein